MNSPRLDTTRERKQANLATQMIANGSILLILISIMVMSFGVLLFESILSPGPTIPEPVSWTLEGPLPLERQRAVNRPPRLVTLFVYPKDIDRLARTLEIDVSRHGGRTLSNKHNRILTFVVPKQYMERIQPLIVSSGTRQRAASYTQWVATAVPEPEPELGWAMPDTTVRFHLRFPLTAHPATLPMMAVTSSIIAATFLAVLACGLIRRHTKTTRI